MGVSLTHWNELCPLLREHRDCRFERITYSYRSASMGSSLAARIAGSIPLTSPTKLRIRVATTIVDGGFNKVIYLESPHPGLVFVIPNADRTPTTLLLE